MKVSLLVVAVCLALCGVQAIRPSTRFLQVHQRLRAQTRITYCTEEPGFAGVYTKAAAAYQPFLGMLKAFYAKAKEGDATVDYFPKVMKDLPKAKKKDHRACAKCQCRYKIDFENCGVEQLRDVIRGSLIFTTADTLIAFYAANFQSCTGTIAVESKTYEYNVVQTKNGFTAAELEKLKEVMYRDVKVMLLFPKESKFPDLRIELQLHLKAMYDKKMGNLAGTPGITGHTAYNVIRTIDEYVAQPTCGILLDKEFWRMPLWGMAKVYAEMNKATTPSQFADKENVLLRAAGLPEDISKAPNPIKQLFHRIKGLRDNRPSGSAGTQLNTLLALKSVKSRDMKTHEVTDDMINLVKQHGPYNDFLGISVLFKKISFNTYSKVLDTGNKLRDMALCDTSEATGNVSDDVEGDDEAPDSENDGVK